MEEEEQGSVALARALHFLVAGAHALFSSGLSRSRARTEDWKLMDPSLQRLKRQSFPRHLDEESDDGTDEGESRSEGDLVGARLGRSGGRRRRSRGSASSRRAIRSRGRELGDVRGGWGVDGVSGVYKGRWVGRTCDTSSGEDCRGSRGVGSDGRVHRLCDECLNRVASLGLWASVRQQRVKRDIQQ